VKVIIDECESSVVLIIRTVAIKQSTIFDELWMEAAVDIPFSSSDD